MSVYDVLVDAIENKKQIHATYDGFYREMCPHALGMKEGVLRCLFYQFGGEGSKGKIILGVNDDWRCMFVEKLSDVTAVEGKWYTADNHSKKASCIDEIYAVVDY